MNELDILKITWISGIFLILIVTFILGIAIPKIDKKIKRKKSEISNLEYTKEVRISNNWQEYLHYTSKRDVARLTCLLLKSSGYPEDAYMAAHGEYLEAQREAMAKLYIVYYGKIPSQELFDKWGKMNIEELIKESKGWKNETMSILLNDIKTKKEELDKLEGIKTNTIIFTTLVQIFGLILIYVGS